MPDRKAGSSRKRKRRKEMKEIGFGISLLISIVLVLGGIVNGILLGTIATALVTFLAGFTISGIIVLGIQILMAALSDYEPEEMPGGLALFIGCLAMFIGSCIVVLPGPEGHGLVIIKDGNSQRVVDSPTFVVPYRVKVDYISDVEVTSIVRLPLDQEREVQWDVKAKLKLIADREKAFNLIKRFGDKATWLSEVRKIFDQAVNDYVLATFKPEKELPSKFKIELNQGQKEILNQLGFELEGQIFVDNVRISRLPLSK
jgi:hypothetical protein